MENLRSKDWIDLGDFNFQAIELQLRTVETYRLSCGLRSVGRLNLSPFYSGAHFTRRPSNWSHVFGQRKFHKTFFRTKFHRDFARKSFEFRANFLVLLLCQKIPRYWPVKLISDRALPTVNNRMLVSSTSSNRIGFSGAHRSNANQNGRSELQVQRGGLHQDDTWIPGESRPEHLTVESGTRDG